MSTCLNTVLQLVRVAPRNISFVIEVKQQFSTNTMADIKAGLPLSKVLEVLETFAPKKYSESWDNTGLLVEPFTPRKITKVLLTNDLTEDVTEEAKRMNVEMIISYHPPIFSPLKSVVQKSWKERIVSQLLESRIALYSPHTSWDAIQGGVNDWLVSCLPVLVSKPLTTGLEPEIGCGRLCSLKSSLNLADVISKVKAHTGLAHVRVAVVRGKGFEHQIKTVALCAGSGASVLKGVPADLYLTGEMLHHDVLDAAQNGIAVILTNHSDSERGYLKVFAPKLTSLLANNVSVFVSEKDADPLTTV